MAVSKILIDGTGIDLTTDTVATADDIAEGKVGHLNTGEVVTGTHSGGGGGAVNAKTYEVVLSSSVSLSTAFTLVSGSQEVITHRNDDNFSVTVMNLRSEDSSSSVYFMYGTCRAKSYFSGSNHYGNSFRSKAYSSIMIADLWRSPVNFSVEAASGYPVLYASPTGDITLQMLNSAVLHYGTYLVIVAW